MTRPTDRWDSGEAYEAYCGRWSRVVAREFVRTLPIGPRCSWLDVGCGTGALTEAVLTLANPTAVCSIDPSEAHVEHARRLIADRRATFEVGEAQAIPRDDKVFDAVVSGLVLNFVPDVAVALSEMTRVAVDGGLVAAYVWDYAAGMELMRRFWDAAVDLDPPAAALDEGMRFPLCRPEPLRAAFGTAGLTDVEVGPIDIATPFRNFDDYWTPFLGGPGPAPGYAKSLPEEDRLALRERLRTTLPITADGRIELTARAWAVKCRKPH
ncbi:MAG: class I SAM-dependent methyltransferase [Acidimicrobiales bacterium]